MKEENEESRENLKNVIEKEKSGKVRRGKTVATKGQEKLREAEQKLADRK